MRRWGSIDLEKTNNKISSPLYYLNLLICSPQINGLRGIKFFFLLEFQSKGQPHADRCKKHEISGIK